MIFGAIALHIRSSVSRSIDASSRTMAACMTPRSGPIRRRTSATTSRLLAIA